MGQSKIIKKLLTVQIICTIIQSSDNTTQQTKGDVKMLTLKQKRAISKFVRENLESRNPRNVRFGDDGAVTVMVDEMPNTNKAGRIFAGWDTQLIKQIAA